ncbi:BON domain-containing protein [Thioalkalivibrio sp. HK1]|uniref:BON domain-containing protein n=1 Tax=Thioalkalivibrio sp. HK1 TaxID=1469245 RepID=UPI0009DE743B|nr:BON domain-containing protein [Thioalkalivibrio sp. HK1]
MKCPRAVRFLAPILVLYIPFLLQGCAAPVIAVGAGAMISQDRRTAGTIIDDNLIEHKILTFINDSERLRERTHIGVAGFNGIVLLTGEVLDPESRDRIEDFARGVNRVRGVHNEIVVDDLSGFGSRSKDAWLTTKVKTALFKENVSGDDTIKPTQVKVISERGVIYLMGLLTREEAEKAREVARQQSGVRRVVEIFEYIQPEDEDA